VDSILEHTLSDQVDNNLLYPELNRDNLANNLNSPVNTINTPLTVNRDILSKDTPNNNTEQDTVANNSTILSNKPMYQVLNKPTFPARNNHMSLLLNNNLNKGRMNPVQ
jgi:hypothetical protein